VQTISLPDPQAVPRSLGFSPDGRLLAVWSEFEALVIDPVAGTVRSLWRSTPRNNWLRSRNRNAGVGFTADGRGVVALRYNYERDNNPDPALCVFDAATGADLRARAAHSWMALEIGPGGRWVYVSTYENNKLGIVRWDPLTGHELPAFGQAKRDLFQIAVSADERCVVASIYAAVRVLKFTGTEPPKRASKQLESDDACLQHALTISADASYVAASGISRDGCRVDAWVVGTGERVAVALGFGHHPVGRNVRFHPARPLLAYGTGTDEVIFWDAASRTELKRFAWGIGPVSALEFSADGLRCAAAGAGKVVIWDVDV
jgi:WD40 repeat protein